MNIASIPTKMHRIGALVVKQGQFFHWLVAEAMCGEYSFTGIR
jgi:hypothetical protein